MGEVNTYRIPGDLRSDKGLSTLRSLPGLPTQSRGEHFKRRCLLMATVTSTREEVCALRGVVFPLEDRL